MFSIFIFLFILFFISLLGFFFTKKHIILLLITLELLLLSINLSLFIFSVFLDDVYGQIFAIIILTIAAAESAVGLAILLVSYRLRGSIFISFINLLKG